MKRKQEECKILAASRRLRAEAVDSTEISRRRDFEAAIATHLGKTMEGNSNKLNVPSSSVDSSSTTVTAAAATTSTVTTATSSSSSSSTCSSCSSNTSSSSSSDHSNRNKSSNESDTQLEVKDKVLKLSWKPSQVHEKKKGKRKTCIQKKTAKGNVGSKKLRTVIKNKKDAEQKSMPRDEQKAVVESQPVGLHDTDFSDRLKGKESESLDSKHSLNAAESHVELKEAVAQNTTIKDSEHGNLRETQDEVQSPCPSMAFMLNKLLTHPCQEHTLSEIRKLAQATSVLPVTSVECERAFSAMNVVKTQLRNRMSNSTLNNLITIRTVGPPLSKFPFADVVNIWYRHSSRRIQFETPINLPHTTVTVTDVDRPTSSKN